MSARLASFLPFAAVSAAAVAASPLAPHTTSVVQEPVIGDAHVRHVTPDVAPSVHTVRASPLTVTVKPGDTLSAISARVCGTPDDYLALAYNNGVRNPDLIYARQVFKVACQAAAQAIADRYGMPGSSPASPPVRHYVSHPAAAPAQQPASSGATVEVSGTVGSRQACIIARESGGNSQVMNGSGHYGLYQFSSSTWAAHGGNPADFGHASVAEQNQVYANTVAQDGYSDWAPYDGC